MFAHRLMTTTLAVLTLAGAGTGFAGEGATTQASAAGPASGLIADKPGKALRLWYDEPAPDSVAS